MHMGPNHQFSRPISQFSRKSFSSLASHFLWEHDEEQGSILYNRMRLWWFFCDRFPQEMWSPSERKMPLELPPELMAEVLCRLPIKVLLQIRCVSKRWHAFIDSQFFIKTHLSRSIQTRRNHFLILSENVSDDVKSIDLDFLESAVDLHNPLDCKRARNPRQKGRILRSGYRNLPEHRQVIVPRWQGFGSQLRQIHIWGTCNGLVLMSGRFSACLWNPSTRKHLPLPELEVRPSFSERLVDLYGFGYDCVSGTYKAIKILKCENWRNNDIQYQVWVYGLQSNSWRKVAQSFPSNVKCERQPGVLVREALHWPVKVKSEMDNEEHDFILAFDLNTEEYRMYSQPKCQNPQFYSRLGSLNGSLCLIYSYLPVGFEIWVMGDHKVDESWTRMTLQQEEFISYPGGFTKATLSNGKDARFPQISYTLSEFGLNIKTPMNFGMLGTNHADICVVSLVSLDGGDDVASDQQNEGMN